MSALPTRTLAPLLQPALQPALQSALQPALQSALLPALQPANAAAQPLTRLEQLRLQLAASPHSQVIKNGAQALKTGAGTQHFVPSAYTEAPFSFDRLAGRLVELLDAQPAARGKPHFSQDSHGRASTSARDARTSWVAARLAEAQTLGETVAWIVWEPRGIPYPPDLVALGLDLQALPLLVVQSETEVLRAADLLLRSGAFGLIVADWPTGAPPPGDGPLGRLMGLCQKHDAALLLLTQPIETKLDSREAGGTGLGGTGLGGDGGVLRALASLRLRVARTDFPNGTFELSTTVLKDKRRGVTPPVCEPRQAPEGLGAGAKRL